MDELMVPFWGHVHMRQFVKGKPNPCGLKNFVCTAPDGLPMDFFLYEGKQDSIVNDATFHDLDIGGKVVIRLASSLPPGSKVYMDRYFTSIHLLDLLHSEREIQGTGTLRKNRIPANKLKTDYQLRKEGRGSHDMIVRDDQQVAVVKWFDNKPVVLASSVDGPTPITPCRRWCKKTKQYIMVNRPHLIQAYNENMGGVDFLDRVIAMYRISARTKKWTVRLLFHLFDFALAASWIEHRRAEVSEKISRKDKLDFLDFRVDVAHSLLNSETHAENGNNSDDAEDETISIGNRKRKCVTPLPHDSLRKKKADHMPEIPIDGKPSRCRLPGCDSPKCRIMCSTCKVYLCMNANRNCYKLFHNL